MKLVKILLAGLLIMGVSTTKAQKINIVEGDLGFLKGESVVNLEYDYSDMSVGKFENEEDYIAKKKAEYNEKEPGRGDQWEESWYEDRGTRFQPMFEELLNKYTGKKGIAFSQHEDDAKYTLKLHTTFTEPGFNVYITRKNAEINAEVTIYETANPDNVLCKIDMRRCPGRSMGMDDYDTGGRIKEAYAKCGKEFGKLIAKKAK